MNPSDLTGRDLDLAVTEALGIDTPWPMGWCEPRKIPELFAEIRRLSGGAWVDLRCCDNFGAYTVNVDEPERDMVASGSTPNEALARLLLMVTQR